MKKYIIDPLHSDISFKIRHLMISNVNGSFSKFDATMESDCEFFSDAKISFKADVDSISTNITDRDNHLKSKDFFDVETFPYITFESTSTEKIDDTYKIKGALTIKGVTNEVCLKGVYNGNDIDAYNQTKYGFELEGMINRKEWGLTFNLEGGRGSLLIGDDVKISISIQMIQHI
jgi:polyisoprenoid-binding protein YceI